MKLKNRHKHKLCGDHPEWMPLDSPLFSDFLLAQRRNVAAAIWLPDGHPDKFQTNTPTNEWDSVFRTWQCSPTPERIVEGIFRVRRAPILVRDNEGGRIDAASRTGRRLDRLKKWMTKEQMLNTPKLHAMITSKRDNRKREKDASLSTASDVNPAATSCISGLTEHARAHTGKLRADFKDEINHEKVQIEMKQEDLALHAGACCADGAGMAHWGEAPKGLEQSFDALLCRGETPEDAELPLEPTELDADEPVRDTSTEMTRVETVENLITPGPAAQKEKNARAKRHDPKPPKKSAANPKKRQKKTTTAPSEPPAPATESSSCGRPRTSINCANCASGE
jgi:hypothetical protein